MPRYPPASAHFWDRVTEPDGTTSDVIVLRLRSGDEVAIVAGRHGGGPCGAIELLRHPGGRQAAEVVAAFTDALPFRLDELERPDG